ncbi:MAG: SdrD B-like domain-containing protein [Clostridiales bacterium]
MQNISGFVYYNPIQTPAPGTGIANVPVALYNTTTGKAAVALTDATGAYTFTNVPPGSYNIIETWGTSGLPTPVDYTANAVAMAMPPEIEPPLSAISVTPPALADALNAITPNLIKVVVTTIDLTGQNFYDGPVGNKALTFTGVNFLGSNLITAASNGTWGTFPGGQPIMSTNPVDPYPGVTPGFTYTTSNLPSDGFFTVMNTRGFSRFPWWPVSDHTTHVETGRFLLINGANPGSVVFTQNVAVTPNTEYALTAWVLNLINQPGFSNPQLSLKVLASDGSVLYYKKVNEIPYTDIPVWYQNGFLFNTGAYSGITVEILSEGPAANGNDYLIDDVALYKVTIDNLLAVKKVATPPVIFAGTDVTITTTVKNTSTIPVNGVIFKDVLDPTLVFTPGSVTVNGSGVGYGAADPNLGFSIGNLMPGETKTVTFHAVATAGASPVKNTATAAYNVFSSGTGDVVTNTIPSNPVFLRRPLHNFAQASADLAESVALEQTALSHILNAEGEKIQEMLALPDVTPAQLLAVNNSVLHTVDAISALECVLKQKLQFVHNQLVGYGTI